MPVKDLLAQQRMFYEVGRIRTGCKRTYVKNGETKEAPAKLDTFRLTSASEPAIATAAGQLGGEMLPWDNRGHHEFEVITNARELLVTIPPDAEAISMWYEMWDAGGCKRRCDSETEQKSGGPCLCAPLLERYPEDERARQRAFLAKKNPPKACALQTRMSFVLTDLPDVGVWRLDTKSYFGAQGVLGKLRIMAMAREQGIFLPARLWIDHQVDVVDGQTRKYPVVQVSLLNTVREIVSGQLAQGGLAAQLPPPPAASRQALTAGTPAPPQNRQLPQAPAADAAGDDAPASPGEFLNAQDRAQQIADLAVLAQAREDVTKLAKRAKAEGVFQDSVCINAADDVWGSLHSVLDARYRELPAPRGGQRKEQQEQPTPPPAAAAAPAGEQADTGDGEYLWPEGVS